jgi:dihydrolipoamide dehydrogenase
LNTKVVAGKLISNGASLTIEDAAGGNSRSIESEIVLISTGRRPFTQGLGLEKIGIETDKLGRIPVDH